MVSRADGFRKGPNSTPGTSGRMKRCSRRWCVIPGRHRANSRTSKPGDRGSHLSRRSGLPPVFLQLVTDRFAAVARKAKRQEWECLLGRSNCLDPAYRKNGFPFPPGRSLGVSFFLGPTPPFGMVRGQPEVQVNLNLGLTPRPPMVSPELLRYGVPGTAELRELSMVSPELLNPLGPPGPELLCPRPPSKKGTQPGGGEVWECLARMANTRIDNGSASSFRL